MSLANALSVFSSGLSSIIKAGEASSHDVLAKFEGHLDSVVADAKKVIGNAIDAGQLESLALHAIKAAITVASGLPGADAKAQRDYVKAAVSGVYDDVAHLIPVPWWAAPVESSFLAAERTRFIAAADAKIDFLFGDAASPSSSANCGLTADAVDATIVAQDPAAAPAAPVVAKAAPAPVQQVAPANKPIASAPAPITAATVTVK